MVSSNLDGLVVVQSEQLLAANIPHGWFGVSLGNVVFRKGNPYNDPEFVSKDAMDARRRRACQALGLDGSRLVLTSGLLQTDIVRYVDASQAGQVVGPADGYITDVPDMPFLLGAADCLQVILYDPARHVLGVVHAGALGVVRKVLVRAVTQMVQQFGSSSSDIIVAIGPSIAAEHYILEDGIERYVIDGEVPITVQLPDGRIGYDIVATARRQLTSLGVSPDHIEVSSIDTYSSPDFYSWRRDKHGNLAAAKRRHGLFVALPPTGRQQKNSREPLANSS
jgi:YfiH family protein